jgi:hypothetical protein
MIKNWPIILLAIALIAILGVSCYTNPSYQGKQDAPGSSAPSARLAQNVTGYSGQPADSSANPPVGLGRLFAWPEGVTVLAVILTLFFIAWQAILTRQSIESADASSRRELRAYLTVVIGPATYQVRRAVEDGGDLRFGCDPIILNTGRTPARKIQFKARAAILPWPLPKETHLPEGIDEGTGDNILGAQQNANMFAVVEGFCQDGDIQAIKDGFGAKALYVWGKITYEDVFGDVHYTRFCQHIYWTMDDKVRGNYIPGRNDAD